MGGEEKIGSSRDSGTTGAAAPDGAAPFTPGPWEFQPNGVLLSPSAQSIVLLARTGVMSPHAEDVALIEAAPDLYEALKECAEALQCERDRHEMHLGRGDEDVGASSALKAADAALAKAEGR